MTDPRIRVAAYVIRERTVPEVLVFDHVGTLAAGTRIPAGEAGPGGEPEQIVPREVTEETGLSTTEVIRRIAVEDKPHPETGQSRRTTFFLLGHRQRPPTHGTTMSRETERTRASPSPAASSGVPACRRAGCLAGPYRPLLGRPANGGA
ncbi:NUDIX domain-containing protein [Streptomyces sp. ML-6]|uniref:NUDIX domain-containing protein n=1 Tax=Streptomyces sp. ML-6 TaxID=2982693 RepID=UPI0032DFEC02